MHLETPWYSSCGSLARLYALLLENPIYHTPESDLVLLALTAMNERPELQI